MRVEIIKVGCPRCGGPNTGEAGSHVDCPYCGSGVKLPETEKTRGQNEIPMARVDGLVRSQFYGYSGGQNWGLIDIRLRDFSGTDRSRRERKNGEVARKAALTALQRFGNIMSELKCGGNDEGLWKLARTYEFTGDEPNPDFVYGFTFGLAVAKVMVMMSEDAPIDEVMGFLLGAEEILAGVDNR